MYSKDTIDVIDKLLYVEEWIGMQIIVSYFYRTVSVHPISTKGKNIDVVYS